MSRATGSVSRVVATVSLSTLEACAYMLSALEPRLDVQPLMTAFDAMVELRIKAMPSTVQARYQNSNKPNCETK